jgi:hypothetical protein
MATTKPIDRATPALSADPHLGIDELNFAEFPLAFLGERPPGAKTLIFSDTVYDSGADQTVTRKLTITGSDHLGLPTATDEDVLVALLFLTKAQNFASRTVHFSRYQLLKILGWPDNGKSYKRLEESLKRWLGVTLYYEKAWWDKRARAWVDKNFHVIDNVDSYDLSAKRKRAQAELPLSSFTWNKEIFQSFQADNLKRLDLDFYFSLDLAPAKRMYRFLDKRFWHGPSWTFDLPDFACEHVGFSRGYDTAQLKRKMHPSIAELETKGFLEPLSPAKRYHQVSRGVWKITLLKKTPALPDKAKPIATKPLEKELIARGVTASTAAELVAAHPGEKIAYHLEVFDWMIETKKKHIAENPAGYLVKSIREDYAALKGFTPKAERERVRQEHEARQQQREEAVRRKEAEKAAAEHARHSHIDSYLQNLSSADRATLEQRALAKAEGFIREFIDSDGPMGEATRRNLIEAEVLRLHPLPEPQPEP